MLAIVGENTNEEKVDSLLKAVDKVGLLFQLVDDILNIEVSGVAENKGLVGEDIKEGKITFLTIHAYEHLEGEEKQRLKEILVKKKEVIEDEILEVIELIKKSGGTLAARERCKELVKEIFEVSDTIFEDRKLRSLFTQLVSFIDARQN